MPRDLTCDLPVIGRAGTLQSVNPDERTFEVVWTTGARVARYSWARDEEFDEELVVSPNAMRLERLQTGAPFLDSHRSYGLDSILGVVVDGSVRVEDGRGIATIRLSERDEVEPIWRDIVAGIIRSVSVGYRVHRFERVAKGDRTDGGTRALYRAVDWEPLEISAVAVGADAGAHIRSDGPEALHPCVIETRQSPAAAAARQKESNMDRDNPAAPEADIETRTVPDPAPVVETPAPGAADVERAARAAVEAERTRANGINALVRRHALGEDMAEDLIARGVDLDAARSAVLDALAARTNAAGPISETVPAQARGLSERDVSYRAAVSAAMMHRADPGRNELPDDAREFRGLTLMELARSALERSGVSTRGMGRMELASAALGQRAAGYHATGDFPAVLANIGNLTLRGAYAQTPRTFTAFARRASLSDFRPTTRVQISNAPQLELVPEGAEFTYGTFGEASQQYALATYGKIIGFTRQMLINDDLGAFTRVAQSFGARAAQLEADLVYAILLQNPVLSDGTALFDADHGNLGTPAVISETSITEAETLFASQVDIDGTAIDVSPRFIIVPPGQRAVEAKKLMTATTPADTSDVNTYANQYQVVTERRLLPAAGGGAAPWFLAADPAMIDTIEYAYLDGNDGIFTESRNGFEVDGVEIKARLDFAASAIDHRGLFKNAGA